MTNNGIAEKYNYREEWSRFINTLSASEDEASPELAVRMIKAVGGVVGANGGAVWLHEAGSSFRLVARTGFKRAECGAGDAPVLAFWLATHDDCLDLIAGEHDQGQVALPIWVPTPPKAWILLPLHHRGWLIGFMILQTSVPRTLDRDDRDLLRLIARNAASYLAEAETSRQLSEAKDFELFNRRFAFIMHDLKNVSGQLALTLSNAAKHQANPAFVSDMVDTIGASVGRMNALIARLRGKTSSTVTEIDVARMINDILAQRKTDRIACTEPPPRLEVAGDLERLRTAIDHILDNALQSQPHGADVSLSVRAVADEVRIEISDNGSGMDEEFIQNRLFAPFETTKPDGFGLGMTEVLEIIDKMNGTILLESEVGSGTTVTLSLPKAQERDR